MTKTQLIPFAIDSFPINDREFIKKHELDDFFTAFPNATLSTDEAAAVASELATKMFQPESFEVYDSVVVDDGLVRLNPSSVRTLVLRANSTVKPLSLEERYLTDPAMRDRVIVASAGSEFEFDKFIIMCGMLALVRRHVWVEGSDADVVTQVLSDFEVSTEAQVMRTFDVVFVPFEVESGFEWSQLAYFLDGSMPLLPGLGEYLVAGTLASVPGLIPQ